MERELNTAPESSKRPSTELFTAPTKGVEPRKKTPVLPDDGKPHLPRDWSEGLYEE